MFASVPLLLQRQRKEEGGFQKVRSGIGQDGAKAMEGSEETEEGVGSKRGAR